MFSLDLQTFLQMILPLVSFAILVFIFKRFLYIPVKNILQKRAEKIETDILTAEENAKKAEDLRLMYETKLKEIEVERAAILEEARKDAAVRVDAILGNAKEEATATKDRAKRDIETEIGRVKAEMHRAIVDISTDIAAKLVTATIDKENHDRLFSEAMDELEATAFKAY